jgi:sialidase-1
MAARTLALTLILTGFPQPPKATAPVFTDVFRSGAEGYGSIRIPAVLATKTGTVLAFAEGRRQPADQPRTTS